MMQMKNLTLSALCMLFFFAAPVAPLQAQQVSTGEKYYSNPQKGIYPSAPKFYDGGDVVEKSDDVSVELERYVPDTTGRRDSLLRSLEHDPALASGLKNAELGDDRYWVVTSCSPYAWSLRCGWDPWLSPWWHGWGPHLSIGWGWSWGWDPYWSLGWSWGWGWGWSPWWYYDWAWWWGYPYYYGWGGYAWGGPHHRGWDHVGGGAGHAYIGGGRGAATSPTTRTSGATSKMGRPATRRGGVDVGRSNGSRLSRPASTRTRTTNQTVRNAGNSRDTRSGLQSRSGYGNGGRSVENGYRSTLDRQLGTRQSRSDSYRNNSGSRSTSTSRSTSSGVRSTGSSSRSLGGSRGGSIGGGSRGGSIGGGSRGGGRR